MSVGLVTATLFLGFSFTPVTVDRPAQAQTAQNPKAEADRLFEAGRRQYRQGRVQEALETFQQVLAIRQGMGDRNGVGETLNEIGLVYENLSQYPKALEFYQQALDISREMRDRQSEGRVQINIGAVYFKLGNLPRR